MSSVGLAFVFSVVFSQLASHSMKRHSVECLVDNGNPVSDAMISFYLKTESFQLSSTFQYKEGCLCRVANHIQPFPHLEFVVKSYIKNQIDFRYDLLVMSLTSRKKLLDLTSAIDFAGIKLASDVQHQPIFYWAQNKSHIFLKIDYKRSRMSLFESTPVLKFVSIRSDYLEAEFFFIKDRPSTAGPFILSLRLKIDYYQQIHVPLSRSYSRNDYSTEFELKKNHDLLWRNVHYRESKILKNQFTWIEVFAQHQKDVIEDFVIWKKTQEMMKREERGRERIIENRIRERKYLAHLKKEEGRRNDEFALQEEFCYLVNDLADQPCLASNMLRWNEWIM
jgi:hypothetical protein